MLITLARPSFISRSLRDCSLVEEQRLHLGPRRCDPCLEKLLKEIFELRTSVFGGVALVEAAPGPVRRALCKHGPIGRQPEAQLGIAHHYSGAIVSIYGAISAISKTLEAESTLAWRAYEVQPGYNCIHPLTTEHPAFGFHHATNSNQTAAP